MDKKQILLLRQELGSIDLDDIQKLKETVVSQEESEARAGDAEIFYKNYFKKVIQLLIQEQLEAIAAEADTEEKLNFCRGTVNGLCILDEWFKQQKKTSVARFDKPEEFEV